MDADDNEDWLRSFDACLPNMIENEVDVEANAKTKRMREILMQQANMIASNGGGLHKALNTTYTEELEHLLLDTGASSTYIWADDAVMSVNGKVKADSTKVGSADAAGKPM